MPPHPTPPHDANVWVGWSLATFNSKNGSWKLQLAAGANLENAIYARQLENNRDWENLTRKGLICPSQQHSTWP